MQTPRAPKRGRESRTSSSRTSRTHEYGTNPASGVELCYGHRYGTVNRVCDKFFLGDPEVYILGPKWRVKWKLTRICDLPETTKTHHWSIRQPRLKPFAANCAELIAPT